MGEIADDHYDRFCDDLYHYEYDQGPFVNDAEPWFPRRRSFAARQPIATPEDFDVLDDDECDLL